MQRPIFTHLPPANLNTPVLEREPGGDVGFVIEVADDNLAPVIHDLDQRQADQADE